MRERPREDFTAEANVAECHYWGAEQYGIEQDVEILRNCEWRSSYHPGWSNDVGGEIH